MERGGSFRKTWRRSSATARRMSLPTPSGPTACHSLLFEVELDTTAHGGKERRPERGALRHPEARLRVKYWPETCQMRRASVLTAIVMVASAIAGMAAQ